MKTSGKFGKILNIITSFFVALITAFAVLTVGARLAGFKVYSVISGSMEPAYSVGDLIYVKSVKPEEIKVGDAITFVMDENLVVATHRVIGIDSENRHFYTKGDANKTSDTPVHFNNLIGKPVFSLPFLGYAADFVRNPPGIYIAIGAVAVLFLAVFLPDAFGKSKKENEE